jgi:hypothetical protein
VFNELLVERVLINPIKQGADKLAIVSGYASPTMASWHMKMINHLKLRPIEISLIVGMCPLDGISINAHEGFKQLVTMHDPQFPKFVCQYVYEGAPVHSKLYIWIKSGTPVQAFAGSANYTQSGFSMSRREYVIPCKPDEALNYYNRIEKDTIYCNHSEVEDCVLLKKPHSILDAEDNHLMIKQEAAANKVTLSLLTREGDVGAKSGLNWGQRDGREPNQAYIPLPADIARSGFFPLNKQHFSVLTDDRKQLILRVEQQNNKAITTPLNNSLIGEYFRRRLGVPNGAYISKADLLRYGRTDVTFYKLDDEQYFMDFSV